MTLNQNEFLASMVNLVVVTRVNSTTNGTRINDLIDACLTDTIEYGEGKLLVSVDTAEVKDYSATSSLLENESATVNEQWLETTDKKFIHLTLNRYLLKGAFADEYSMSEAIAMILSMLQKTKQIYLYKKIVSAFENWEPALEDDDNDDTQTITIDLVDTSNMSGNEKIEAEKDNALRLYKVIRAKSLAMQTPSRKYNDIKFEEMYNADELEFIVNGNFDELINTYAYASLLQSDKLNNIKLYEKSIIIPEEQFTSDDAKTTLIGFLASKYKYQIAPRFEVATNFFDGSNLNDQNFLHFWLNSGFARGLACIKLVANFVTPEEPVEPEEPII